MHEIEEEFLDFLKYWKSQNNRMNKKDKLKCICSAGKQCKLAKKLETSASFGSQNLIVNVMKEALLDDDHFVRYSAARTLGDAINQFENTDFVPLFSDVISSMFNIQYEYRVSLLDFLGHQVTQTVIEKNWLQLVTVMGKQWMQLCAVCLMDSLTVPGREDSSFLTKKTSDKVVMHCQFLQLWKRIIKRCANSKQENLIEFLKPVLNLISKIKPKILENKMTFRAVLKLIYTVVRNIGVISEFGTELKDLSVQLGKAFVGCFSPEWFEEFSCDFKDGFGGELTVNSNNQQGYSILRTVANICIKLVSVIPKLGLDPTNDNLSSVFETLTSLDTWMGKTIALSSFLWVPCVYSEQDDGWIDILMTLLEIYMEGKARSQNQEDFGSTQDALNKIQPHQQFLLFLDNTGFDDTLIVDLLVSPETCFLSYFTQYLRVVFSEWTEFVNTHSEYRSATSLKVRNESKESLNIEKELNSDEEKTSASVNEIHSDLESNMSHGLSLLQQYDDDEDEQEEEEELLEDSAKKSDCDKDYQNKDSELIKDKIDHSKSCDFPLDDVSMCLDQTMAVLIRVRLKMEKYKDSSIIQYNPTVLIHLIEKVEELYEQ